MDVRIVRLEHMRYASACGYGDTPETTAQQKLLAWAEPKGLLNRGENSRIFGFNNPYPTDEHPRYGYELWLSVPLDTEPEGDIRIGDFFGGLYAVTRCEGVQNIFPTWQQLMDWIAESEYRSTGVPGLEEHISSLDTPPDRFVFDFYAPIHA